MPLQNFYELFVLRRMVLRKNFGFVVYRINTIM